MADTDNAAPSEVRRNWGVVLFLAAALLFLFGQARTGRPVELSFAAEAARTRLCLRCGQKFLSTDGRCTVCGCRDSRDLPAVKRTRANATPVAPTIRIHKPLDPEALKARGKDAKK